MLQHIEGAVGIAGGSSLPSPVGGRLPASRAGFVALSGPLLRRRIGLSSFGSRSTILPSIGSACRTMLIAVAVLVHERRADGEPKVVLAFALDDGVGAICGCWLAIAGLLSGWWGLVLVGAHDGEHARRLLGVGGIFRTAVHVEGVVVDFEEVGFALDLEAAEVVLAVRVVVRGEFVERLHGQEHAGFGSRSAVRRRLAS